MKDEYKEMLCRVRFIDGVPAKTYLSDIEIVQCEKCKYSKCIDSENDWYECQHDKRVNHFNGFCNWAERKEHETD